ncbi:MAG: hypothetical protein JW732_01900 [Dehalococcoidia bacterium]|nr:hypothetical protein [Dehalococcoidia bacterium]
MIKINTCSGRLTEPDEAENHGRVERLRGSTSRNYTPVEGRPNKYPDSTIRHILQVPVTGIAGQ